MCREYWQIKLLLRTNVSDGVPQLDLFKRCDVSEFAHTDCIIARISVKMLHKVAGLITNHGSRIPLGVECKNVHVQCFGCPLKNLGGSELIMLSCTLGPSL